MTATRTPKSNAHIVDILDSLADLARPHDREFSAVIASAANFGRDLNVELINAERRGEAGRSATISPP